MITQLPQSFIFMKVGSHAGEAFENILQRKNREFQQTGRIFWGYGGVACHPLKQVQPFARIIMNNQGSIFLVMENIVSHADPDLVPAEEYSADGVTWEKIPEGVHVLGSRYALILGEIQPGELLIPTDDFRVAVGPSAGKTATEYLHGRTDKACLIRGNPQTPSGGKGKTKKASYVAKVLDPYAVMLR